LPWAPSVLSQGTSMVKGVAVSVQEEPVASGNQAASVHGTPPGWVASGPIASARRRKSISNVA